MNTHNAKLTIASLFALTAFAASGCAAIEHNAQEGDTMLEGEDAIRSRATWFRVRGATTMGAFSYEVRAPDSGTIACPGSTAAPSCFVGSVNYSALRMPADDISEIDAIARSGNLLIKGSLKVVSGRPQLVATEAYESVGGAAGGSPYYDRSCMHGWVRKNSGESYMRGARLIGAPYNDTVRFESVIENHSSIIVDARDLVAEAIVSPTGLLVCMDSSAPYVPYGILLNVKDTYAP